jgi:hypothetical protein
MIFDINAEVTDAPEDFYTTISDATEAAKESHTVNLEALHNLYPFELYKIVKIGGTNKPYACIEWPGIQIP